MSTWQEEAVGIVPWPGAKLWRFGLRGSDAWTIEVAEDGTVQAHDEGAPAGCNPCEYRSGEYRIDLDHADTLAAFDRRLALRLGAPEDAVRELVGVVRYTRWTCVAGAADEDGVHAWSYALSDTNNDLLARVRAWKGGP